jgi:hypothetical protein
MVVVRKLDQLLSLLGELPGEETNDLMSGLAVMHLGRFKQEVATQLQSLINPDRPMRALLQFAALYHDAAKPTTSSMDEQGHIRMLGHDEKSSRMVIERARVLQLSNEEIQRLGLIVRHHMRVHLLAKTGNQPSRRAIYRFFKDTGEVGVDICLLGLADTLATYGHTLTVETWTAELEVCRTLFEAWWEKSEEVVRPLALVNGHDLMKVLKIGQGPILGELLEALREAQAMGEIQTREEALTFAGRLLEEREK